LVHSHTSGWEKGSIVSEEVVGKSPDYHALQNFLEKIYRSLSKYPYPHIYQSFFYNRQYILWDVKWCWGHLGRLCTFEFMVCTATMPKWRQVWKLNVPPKVHSFWWRMLRGSVAIQAVMKQRHIEQTTTCLLCGVDEETVFHTIIECPRAKLC
jgi:hypothetical protein